MRYIYRTNEETGDFKVIEDLLKDELFVVPLKSYNVTNGILNEPIITYTFKSIFEQEKYEESLVNFIEYDSAKKVLYISYKSEDDKIILDDYIIIEEEIRRQHFKSAMENEELLKHKRVINDCNLVINQLNKSKER